MVLVILVECHCLGILQTHVDAPRIVEKRIYLLEDIVHMIWLQLSK
jgi:hypothetical protein